MQADSDSLSDVVAIVTGGARGLGASFARQIVTRGGKVVISDVLDDDGAALAADLGGDARYIHLDVTDAAQWQSAVELALSEFGKLNGLVNNAGISTGQFIEHEPLDHFRTVLEVNLVGVFNGLQAVIARAAINATVDGLAPHGELLTLAVLDEALDVTPLQLINSSGTVHGHPAGVAADTEDTLEFAALHGIRPWVEPMPLSDAAAGYDRMMQNKARFRVVLTMADSANAR